MKLSAPHQRIVTGLLLLLILAAVIAAGGWPLRLALILVSSLALYEFYEMYWPGIHRERKVLGIALGALIILSQACAPLWTLAALALCMPAVGAVFLFDYGGGNIDAKLGHYAPILHGIVYIPVVLQLALYLSPADQCLVMLAAIATDTGGYYAGTHFGLHKIWPQVSPKKSWEGFYGGMALCVLACTAFGVSAAMLEWRISPLPFWGWILAGLLLNQAALFGDFFESALKRSLGVKDSGSILPGHGGMLDRIDSTLFVLPVYMLVHLAFGPARGV